MPQFKSGALELDDYAGNYPHLKMERTDGVLLVTMHDGDGGPIKFDFGVAPNPHGELSEAFYDIGRDHGNKAVIITGAGGSFFDFLDFGENPGKVPGSAFVGMDTEGIRLVMNQINIPVPMIAAVDGPVNFLGQIPLLCDIVIATPRASFRDGTHFRAGVVPGDGANIVWPLALGPGRGRYFLLTGETIEAQEAKSLGFVQEIVAPEHIVSRAREIALAIASQPTLSVRYTRAVLTQDLKKRIVDELPFGLASEILCATEHWGQGRHP